MAAEAGELLLRVGAPLPKLEERALTKKDHRFYKTADAMYSENTNTVTFNKPRVKDVHKFYGSYKNYEESQVKDGWLSQPNMFLHELGHYLDHYFGKEQPDNRIGDLFSRLDEKKVEADVSGYAATSKAEFMAELYSGILSGKVYPEEYLKAANLDYYTKVEIAQQMLSMASGEVPNTTALQQQWGDMIHAVYTEGGASFKIELLANPEVEKFIDTHAQVLDNTFALTDMSDVMRERLQKSDYIFSGIKTFHELHEVFPSLLDEDGKRKPFEQFLSDVQKVDNTYNRNYLNAEYNFAQASSEMAGKWEDFVEDGDDYLLQYRTQQDSKVRPEHAELHGITLPVTDSFWDEYFPPNGWNCRCTVVQVLKGKNVPTDHDEAMSRGKVAVAKDTKGMFRFNPGKEMRTFPAYNAYTISKCATCDKAKLKLLGSPNELCAECSHLCDKVNTTIIDEHRSLFNQLLEDPNYTDVEFDETTGGVCASHIGHNFDKIGGEYEKDVMSAGMNTGHVVIMGDERSTSSRHTEGTWDGLLFEVAGRETGTENNVLKGLKHCADKRTTQIAILDYPNGNFDLQVLEQAIRRYKGLEKLDDGQFIRFQKIICIQKKQIVYEEYFR